MSVVGTIQPVPTVQLAGQPVASGPSADGSWPTLMVVDGVSVTWGRDNVLNHPSSPTARVTIFDPTSTWAAAVQLVGLEVTVTWTVGTESRVCFRGRVSVVALTRKTVRGPDGQPVTGALVTLSCASLLTDLGNRKQGIVWPPETAAARRDRTAALLAGPVSSVTIRPGWEAAPLAVSGQGGRTGLDVLDALYDSTGGDRWSWDPHTRAVDYIARRQFPAGAAGLYRDPAVRSGVYVASLPSQRDAASPVRPPLFIDAAAVEYSGSVTRDLASQLTRVELSWQDPGTGSAATIYRVFPGVVESQVGYRAATLTTDLTAASWAELAADGVVSVATGEATGWQLGRLTWDTGRTGGFQTMDQVRLLLSGCELDGVYFLGGSWLPQLGVRPVFGVMGGTLTYRNSAWSVAWTNAPIAPAGAAERPITWDEIDAGQFGERITWDEDSPLGLHESVTFDDLAHVTYGLGGSTTPAGV